MAVRVLIADGSGATREAIRQHLECIGCEVVAEVETAAQALALFRTIRPEVVTLAVALSYGGQPTPLDLLKLIKRESPKTSIVMIGEVSSAEQRENFVREGALDCVRLDGGSLHNLWRKLSLVHAELRKTEVGAILEHSGARAR
jgi:DNA-binding NarL/FixJ family response regulator